GGFPPGAAGGDGVRGAVRGLRLRAGGARDRHRRRGRAAGAARRHPRAGGAARPGHGRPGTPRPAGGAGAALRGPLRPRADRAPLGGAVRLPGPVAPRPPAPGGRPRPGGQARSQDSPLRVNSAGWGLEPLHEPLKPTSTVVPGGRELFQGSEAAVTSAPLWVQTAFQPWVMRCPAGKAKDSSQAERGSVPVLVIRSEPVKPPVQSLVAYSTRQEEPPPESARVVKETELCPETLPSLSRAATR